MRYTVYISRVSYRGEFKKPYSTWDGGSTAAQWVKHVNANSRHEALTRAIPALSAELPKLAGKYVSVYVGQTKSISARASRLEPIQIEIATGQIRNLR